MTMPEVSCTAVAVPISSEWPCSRCPFPQLRLVGVRTSYIYFSNISWTPWVLDPITNPYLGSPLLAAPCYKTAHCPLLSVHSDTVQTDDLSFMQADAIHFLVSVTRTHRGQPEIMDGKEIIFSIPTENSNRKKKYQFIFLFTSIRKYYTYILLLSN